MPQFLGELVQPLPSGFLPGTLLVLLVVALAVAWRRRWTNEGLLVGGLLLTWIVAFVAASNISGPAYSWLYLWVHPLMWLSWAAVALVAWRLLSASTAARPRPWLVPAAGAAAALVLIGFLVGHARRAVDGAYVWEDLVTPIDELAQAAEASVDRTAPVFLTFDGDAYLAHAVHAGLVNQLDQRGVDVAVVPEAAAAIRFAARHPAPCQGPICSCAPRRRPRQRRLAPSSWPSPTRSRRPFEKRWIS